MPVLDLHVLVEHGISNVRQHPTVILGRGRNHGHSVLGLAVDEVLRVVDLPRRGAAASDASLVGETVEFEGTEVKVLNTQQLLQEERADSGAKDG